MGSPEPQRPRPAPAKRSLGQNFLQDQNTARRIVAALELHAGDRVLEIGPGQGALTRWILEAGPLVAAALEKDADLARSLHERWPELAVVYADGLRFDWSRLDCAPAAGEPGWKLVGNLPYNVASPLIWDICSGSRRFDRAVFMVQKEVGQRLAAGPGSKTYGALSVWVQSFCTVRPLFVVGPGVFRPRPKVDSMVLAFAPRENLAHACDPLALGALVKACFSKRRKQIKNILKDYWSIEVCNILEKSGHGPASRPEQLAPEVFQELAKTSDLRFPA